MNDTDMLIRQKIHAHIGSRTQEREFQNDLKELGRKACRAFPKEIRQMRSLENIAFRSRSVVDVFDFVKSQTGRSDRDEKWLKDRLGPELLEKLEGLSKTAENIAEAVGIAKGSEKWNRWVPLVHKELAQEMIRYLVSDYLYRRSVKEEKNA
jgi:hypothetical protein